MKLKLIAVFVPLLVLLSAAAASGQRIRLPPPMAGNTSIANATPVSTASTATSTTVGGNFDPYAASQQTSFLASTTAPLKASISAIAGQPLVPVNPGPSAPSGPTVTTPINGSSALPPNLVDASVVPFRADGSCGTWPIDDCFAPRYRIFVFAEVMSLQARDSEVAYAVEINGPIVGPGPPPPLQVGPVGVVDQSGQFAYCIGGGLFLGRDASLAVSYTRFSSDERDSLSRTDPNNVLRSLVAHPQSMSAATDFNSATARHDINFNLYDVEYRSVWLRDCNGSAVVWLAGLRYASLEQRFGTEFQDNGVEFVDTNVEFDGLGPKLGLEGERAMRLGFSLYGKSAASFVVGDFTANYLQGSDIDPVIVTTSWESGRIVPILDFELGVAWTSPRQRFRLKGGYLVSAWLNSVKTDDWIKAVQANNFVGLGDTMTFDGFIGHAEVRF